MSDEIRVLVKSNGSGRNLAMYYVDPVSGKRVVKTTRTTDQREAERTAGEWEKELQRGGGHSPSKITWQHFRERYEAEYMPGLSKSSRGNFNAAFHHLERVMNPDRLCKLTTACMSGFQAKLRAGGKLKETSIAGILRHLKAALSWAERQTMIDKAPRFTMPKVGKGSLAKGRPIVAEEFERMLSVAEKVRPKDAWKWQRLLTGLWLSGLRLGEALELSWDHEAPFCIDLTGKRPVFVIRAEAQKNRRDEILPMTPDFAEWLQATYPEGERQGWVFGIRMRLFWVSTLISGIGRKAGVMVNKADGKYASAHDLRRAFGTRWAKKVTTPILQRLMRHADIKTTMSYYVDIDATDIADGLWATFKQEKIQNGNTYGNTLTEKPLIPRK